MYGHVKTLAEAEKKGIEAAGGTADLYQSVHPVHSVLSNHYSRTPLPNPRH
jgi:hypothetical protein